MADVLQKWRDARQHLKAALQVYSTSVTALDFTFCANSNTLDTNALDAVALEAQQDSNLIESGIQLLREGRVVLNAIRNRSIKRVPSSKLPHEVLLEIFRLAARMRLPYYHDPLICSNQHFSLLHLFRLSHVCVVWRKILLATPSLWSYLDMTRTLEAKNLENPLHCIQTSIQRSCGRPLYLDLDFSPDDDVHEPLRLLSSKIFFLPPANLPLHSIHLHNSIEHEDLVAVLSRIIRGTSMGSIQNLVIWRDDEHTSDPFIISDFDENEDLLQSLRVMCLNNLGFRWNTLAYRNLVQLHISGCDFVPDSVPWIDQLLEVLSGCPKLHTLQLVFFDIESNPYTRPQPVVMEHLRMLDLHYMSNESLNLLLPLLVIPRSNELSLRLLLDHSSHVKGEAIEAFLARTNITRLFVFTRGAGAPERFQTWLAAAQNIRTLILEHNGLIGNTYLYTILRSSAILMLCSLYLRGATYTGEVLYEFVKTRPSLKRMGLMSCAITAAAEEASGTEVAGRLKSLGLEDVRMYEEPYWDPDYDWYHTMP